MVYAGIDGCKLGWILMRSEHNDIRFGGMYPSLEDLVAAHQDLDRIFIDMPIGLSSKTHRRTLEKRMRSELGSRSSTVFDVPCRESLQADSYPEAKQINFETVGKKFSIQSYNISKKIKEVDQILEAQPSLRNRLIESHPEICFKHFNGAVVQSKKSKPEGLEERLLILEKRYPKTRELFNEVLNSTKRKDLKADDIVDALCLCLANSGCGTQNLRFLLDGIQEDERGIPIRIGYCVP